MCLKDNFVVKIPAVFLTEKTKSHLLADFTVKDRARKCPLHVGNRVKMQYCDQ